MNDATLHQKYFLSLMAAEDINYKDTISLKLSGIAKGVGIEFKNDTTDKQSNSFREKMMEKQKRNKEKMNDGR